MRYATIGILLLAWGLLACDEKEEVSGPSVPFPEGYIRLHYAT